MVSVKACRIKSLQNARHLIWLGFDYLGLHAVKELDQMQIQIYRQIADYCRHHELRSKAVIVCKNHTADSIAQMAFEISPSYVQLHDRFSVVDTIRLIRKIRENGIGLISVIDPSIDSFERIRSLAEASDFLLFDYIRGGTGQLIEESLLENAIKASRETPFFIAGGLNSKNIAEIIKKYSPYGVDVQSSLESPVDRQTKDLSLCRQFIAAAKLRSEISKAVEIPPFESILAIALAEVNSQGIELAATSWLDSTDLFHLDHGIPEGNASHYYDCTTIAASLAKTSLNRPYDLHAFVTPEDLVPTAQTYLSVNPLLRVVFQHFDPEKGRFDLVQARHNLQELEKCQLSYGIALQCRDREVIESSEVQTFLEENPAIHLSLVGPSSSKDSLYANLLTSCLETLSTSLLKLTNPPFIDRSNNQLRLAIAAELGIRRAVVGKIVSRSIDPASEAMNLLRFISN